MQQRTILRPKFTGTRFSRHTLPIELLSELHVLERLIIDIAKWQHKQTSTSKSRRLPRDFKRHLELHIGTIEEGSAIVPMVLLVVNSLLVTETEEAVEAASKRVVSGFEKFIAGGDATEYIPQEFLRQFSKMGSRLRGCEAIELSEKAVVTHEVHKKLSIRYGARAGYNEDAEVRGKVEQLKQSTLNFVVETPRGKKVKVPLSESYRDKVIDAFRYFKKVEVTGFGKFDRTGELLEFEEVDDVTILDSRDIAARIDELAIIEDGWLDGEGRAPSRDRLTDLKDLFETYFFGDLPLPFLLPTESGGVRAEWSTGVWESSLDIDLESMSGYWHTWNKENDEDSELDLNLDEEEGWDSLRNALMSSGAETIES